MASSSLRWALAPAALAAVATACSQDTSDLFHGGQGVGGAASATSSGSTGKGATATTGASSTASNGSSVTSTVGATTAATSSTASGSTCGDGVIDGAEQCDGANLGSHSCTDKGYVNPAGATCTASCTIDYAGCKPTCGNGVVEPGEECDDGNLNRFDYCSNECKSQGTCAKPVKVQIPLGNTQFEATTKGTSQLTSMLCQDATGPELVYELMPQHNGFLTAWTDPQNTDYDSLVYALTACGGNEIQCGDNTPHEPDLVSFPVIAGQAVTLVVDGFQQASGKFQLHVNLSVGTCADPVPILVGDQNGVAEHALGDTTGQGDDSFSAMCGGHGPDVTYAVTRMAQGQVAIATSAMGGLQSVTYARTQCDSALSEITCNSGNPNSNITINNVGSMPTYLWIDSKQGTQGPYDVSLTP